MPLGSLQEAGRHPKGGQVGGSGRRWTPSWGALQKGYSRGSDLRALFAGHPLSLFRPLAILLVRSTDPLQLNLELVVGGSNPLQLSLELVAGGTRPLQLSLELPRTCMERALSSTTASSTPPVLRVTVVRKLWAQSSGGLGSEAG